MFWTFCFVSCSPLPLVGVSLGYLRSGNLITHPSAAERAAHLITDRPLNPFEELELLHCIVSKLG